MNPIPTLRNKSLAISLIILGSALEIYFYAYRFYSDSGDLLVSIVEGVALTILLIVLFILRKKWYIWLLLIPLVLYSIFNTAAGQRQSLIIKAENQVIGINTEQIEILEKTLIRKNELFDKTSEMINNSIVDFQDMWDWKNTTKKYEDQQKLLDTEIREIESEISELKIPKVDESESGKIYQFYAGLSGVPAKWVQFWLQVALSLFIAIMSPAGIVLLGNGYNMIIDDTPVKNPPILKSRVIKKTPISKKPFPKYRPKKIKLSENDIDNIIMMLMYKKGNMLTAEEAAFKFIDVHKKQDNVESYSMEKCKIVRDEIIRQKLWNADYKDCTEKIDREGLR